jgi:penicillin-binding protein 2
MLVTPMQLASSMVAMANRGKNFTPRFVKRLGDEEIPVPELAEIKVDEEHWDAINLAMKKVVHGAKGTANRINRGAKYRMAGKTGSAQIIGIGQDEEYDEDQVAKRKKDHGLFVAFAPVENPKIVVAIIVENGVHGSWVSPIARKVFDAYLLDQGLLDDDSSSALVAKTIAEGAIQ